MTNSRTTFWTILSLIVASVLLFPACSTDQGDSLARIKNAGQISFAMEGTFPPFNFYSDKNELVGFDVDVAREMASRLGVRFRPVITEWSGIIEGLLSRTYDGILASMAVTEERLRLVNFSVPYYYSGAQLMVRKDAPFKGPEDLRGRTIGVCSGTTYENDAKDLGAGDIRLYKDDIQALTELHKGAVDGAITDKVMCIYIMNREKLDIKPLGATLRSERMAVAFRKEDVTLLKKVNKILEAMHKDGTLNSLIIKVALGGYDDSVVKND